MKRMKYWIILFSLLLINVNNLRSQQKYETAKPWTYWWWMGSAVDKPNIDTQLQDFANAGIGGVHVIPIYGVKGFENQFIDFLSEDWLEIVAYTKQKANELNLGLDLTLGTGWPYGGPWISPQYAAKKLLIEELNIGHSNRIRLNPEQLKTEFGFTELVAAYAFNKKERINLTSYLNHDSIKLDVPVSDWKISIFGLIPTGQMVKRAAPGGEGLVMDYFNEEAVNHYLQYFDSVFTNTNRSVLPRAFYHDSYEVFGADWTPDFSEEFKRFQGYDLTDHLYIINDTSNAAYPHILHDIRATLSELLHEEFTKTWVSWSSDYNCLTRNQAHGSPGNILDLYSLADIPETESFGCSEFDIPGLACDPDYDENMFGRPSPLMMKFASSPAHLLDKPLVSSETGTWLANHFKVSLRRVKPQIDELFIGGINHVFYHGTTYSPVEEGFPGWLFYASTNFGQTSHFRDEFPLLNHYIENCQRLLQEAEPDNDILLYFPINDLWTKRRGELRVPLDVHHYANWFSNSEFGKTAELLWNKGYTFDYISNKQISNLKVNDHEKTTISGKSAYKTIIVPAVDYIPKTALDDLKRLAKQGLKVIFVDDLPQNYSGFSSNLLHNIEMDKTDAVLRENPNFILSENLCNDLEKLNILNEELKIKGLDFIRKTNSSGKLYFISNLGNQFYEDTITLDARYNFLTIIDPQTNKSGFIETNDKFFLKVPPGKSYLIQTSLDVPLGEKWMNYSSYDTVQLTNKWIVNFNNQEKFNLQETYTIDSLSSWTTWEDQHLKSYAGKARYTSSFVLENPYQAKSYTLQIDDIRETAQVIINGTACGTIWAYPNQLEIPQGVLKKENTIEIIVQNLSANYMKVVDKENPEWKKFYDINFVDITYKPFDPSNWELMDSGLIGEIYLVREK